MIKRDARAADRPIRQRKGICETDMIDSLDTVGGGPYHHGGPYDATLISRNLSKKYSPVAAVQRSNLEALRATPRENIVDSLTKHVPLQGTSTIPPGARDMSGRVMHYKEGADLMREPDAPGGAYKRWDHGVVSVLSCNDHFDATCIQRRETNSKSSNTTPMISRARESRHLP